jgi:hypothetical protein
MIITCCGNHPFWPYVQWLVNTVYLTDIDTESGRFLPVQSYNLDSHFSPMENEFPIPLGKEEKDFLLQLHDILNDFMDIFGQAFITEIWNLYEKSINLPQEIEEQINKDFEWFKKRFRFPMVESFTFTTNFLEREHYGSLISTNNELIILSGPINSYPKNLIRHEVAHFALESLIHSIENIEQFLVLFARDENLLKRNGYWGYDVRSTSAKVLSDSFVRAITYYLVKQDGEDIKNLVDWDIHSGFCLPIIFLPYLEIILEQEKIFDSSDINDILIRTGKQLNMENLFNTGGEKNEK